MATLTIANRFHGPPQSANGGYFSGLVAGLTQQTLRVRLLRPPPLDTELQVKEQPDGSLAVLDGETLIGQAWPATIDLDVPAPPSREEAIEASRRYAGFEWHPFPTCFVCGPHRERGDGLRIFAGRVAGRSLVAAPWTPDPSLDRGDGKVRPEFMWAALDCPGNFAIGQTGRIIVLGEFTAHADRLVHVDEQCTVIGWHLQSSGRKHEVGTAIFDEDGELCGRARALWIEPAASATTAPKR
ncbi:MAG: hypothetical protein DIU56_007490 [Pseudomonadota bacterium]|jgi:hypothetical protein|nr:MAG: hypothetical protein DIU56_02600 [Pseudomonadota bacterium]